ncbi:hypothetical protein ACFYZE_21010 [Streptomyces sp. NPDC001796]|uniref:hypothetical protein n=1 Tax=Streptomyces sp. NPDC001796 TaxID=3364609 RepID=UPI0036B9DB5E
MAEIEGLYTALLRATSPRRQQRLRAELARAAERLAALAAVPGQRRGRVSPVPPRRTRQERRRALAELGAAWINERYGRSAR